MDKDDEDVIEEEDEDDDDDTPFVKEERLVWMVEAVPGGINPSGSDELLFILLYETLLNSQKFGGLV